MLRYSVTWVPLSLAYPHSTLTKNPNHHFRNYLIDISKDCESTTANEGRWIIDTMSAMRAIKVKETYKEWYKAVINFILPRRSWKPLSIEYMNDVYQCISAKNCSKDERRPSETRVPFQSLAFFHNIKNKKHLFRSFITYLCPD